MPLGPREDALSFHVGRLPRPQRGPHRKHACPNSRAVRFKRVPALETVGAEPRAPGMHTQHAAANPLPGLCRTLLREPYIDKTRVAVFGKVSRLI